MPNSKHFQRFLKLLSILNGKSIEEQNMFNVFKFFYL